MTSRPDERPAPAATGQLEQRAVFLTTAPEPVFAMVHLPPAGASRGTTGVVLCPTLGGEELFVYRIRRAWAQALAQAGHPALRLDLPATGDSPGSAREGDRLAAWLAAIAGAATWLREETGCARVAALGVGLGGLLPWLAATEGAPIDDLMLWGVPTRGSRLLRELRVSAALEIDHALDRLAPPVAGHVPGEEVEAAILDEAGQLTSAETVAALSRIDVTQLALPEGARRRVLLFARPGIAEDAAVRGYFEAAGAEVTVADGRRFDAMMRYIEEAETPTAAISSSLGWLRAGAAARSGDAAALSTAGAAGEVTAAGELTLEHEGVAIRERTFTLEVGRVSLRGIVTEPVAAAAAVALSAVFFSGASDRRVGPNRLWVEMARRWAARGVTCVRVDPEGIGDSDGDETYWADARRHYDPRQIERTVALLDALEAQGLPARFVLVGFCSGGYRAFHIARRDPRIAGAFAIAFPFFLAGTRRMVTGRHSWIGQWQRRPGDARAKVAILSTLRALWRTAERARRSYSRRFHSSRDTVVDWLRALSDSGVELLLLFRSNSLEFGDMFGGAALDETRAMPGVAVRLIPGSDVRFRPLALQRYVSVALDEAMTRVLARRG